MPIPLCESVPTMEGLSLLALDPRQSTRLQLAEHLPMWGVEAEWVTTLSQALAPRRAPTLVLVDTDALDHPVGPVVTDLHRRYPAALILVLVQPHQSREAGEALRLGAVDYLQKPFSALQLHHALQEMLLLLHPMPNLVVRSHAARQVIQLARRAAHTSASVLITGESGTGKECLAQFIHAQSPRRDGPYVAINCAAIPENMLESMLFGYSKGAFTGAVQSMPGKFELAQGGTLVLDEIGELPPSLQAKLLRVLQERTLERLGSHQSIRLDVRVIAASNRDLRTMVARGEFRQDLYYRLDVLPLSWPALRERPVDILPLAQHFIDKYAPQQGYTLSGEASQCLLSYDWPGNVRELENVMQRALILCRGLSLQLDDLQLPQAASSPIIQWPGVEGVTDASAPRKPYPITDLHSSKRSAEFQCVLETLRRFHGHRTRTAEALGMTTRALRYKLAAMREQGIDIDQLVRQ